MGSDYYYVNIPHFLIFQFNRVKIVLEVVYENKKQGTPECEVQRCEWILSYHRESVVCLFFRSFKELA